MLKQIFPLHAAFIAIPLEGETKSAFQQIQERLKNFDDSLRLANPENPHLTLQYWKELMEIEYHQVLAQAEKIAVSSEPFRLKIEGVGTFGSRGEDRVLFLTIPFSEDLARLKKKCPWPSLQPFSPHITLARIHHPQRFARDKKKILKLIDDVSFAMNVDRLRLYAEIDGKKTDADARFSLLTAITHRPHHRHPFSSAATSSRPRP